MSSLTRQDSIRELNVSPSDRQVLADRGTTTIAHLADVSRGDLEALGIDVNSLNERLEDYGFNPVL